MSSLLSTSPWKHQRQAIEHCDLTDRVLLSMDVGTGKSLVAIANLLRRGLKRAIVICPTSMVDVWPEEFAKHCAVKTRTCALPLNKPVKERARIAREVIETGNESELTVIITNYECAWREPLASVLLKHFKPDALIVDEAQRVKSSGSRQSRFCQKLAKRTPIVACLTGTPLHNSPLDAFGIFKVLDEKVFGTRFDAFREEYALLAPGPAPNVPYVVGYKNLVGMAAKIRPYAFRVTAKEVLDLPEKVFSTRYSYLCPDARKVYDDLDRDFLAWLESSAVAPQNVLTKLLRLQQVANGYVPDEAGEIHKIDGSKERMLIEYLQEIPEDEAVVVFTLFRSDIHSVHEAARLVGRKSCEISGRKNDLRLFSRSEGPTVCAVQMRAGGAGISLVRARHAAYYTRPWSLGDRKQTIGRLHRPGQSRPVIITDLMVKGTVDEMVYGALQQKVSVVDSVMERMQR